MVNKTKLLTISTLLILNTQAHGAAENISREILKNVNGERFWQVEVICTGETNLNYLKKKIDGQEWCFLLGSDVCFSKKQTAADKICDINYDASSSYTFQPNNITTAQAQQIIPQPQVDVDYEFEDDDDDLTIDFVSLQREKAALESELSQIRLKNSELKRQEAELRNQSF